jgi:hypothetical protein
MGSSSTSTNEIRCVAHKIPVINHEMGKEEEIITTTNGTYA